ncbi:MAG: glutamate--cysteine ligase [Planctomycetota bacterium]|jgi:glutamate--cysteine ligase
MPTENRTEAITAEQARLRIQETAYNRDDPGAKANGPGKIGLEPECFPIRVDADGVPCGRLHLKGAHGTLSILDRFAAKDSRIVERPTDQAPPPLLMLANGGRLTFEPGGQIEHSTAVHSSGAAALDDAADVTEMLSKLLGPHDTMLAFTGLDLWNDVKDVPQQLDAPRYYCMASYFAKRSEGGRTMMRHTASMQVNLDLGPPGVAEERWLIANLASPFATATFASSPEGPNVSSRAMAWQALDVTRTGFPAPLVLGTGNDPVEHWTAATLAADVMIFWKADGTSTCGTPGFTFGDWLENGHPDFGWPTISDLDYHLTTLFFEVRLRGFYELRAIEAVPPHLRAVPTVLFAGLMYDDQARQEALGQLDSLRSELPSLWLRSARVGLADDVLFTHSENLWTSALAGARRLPTGFFRPEHLQTAACFLEEYTANRKAPVDDVRAALANGPKAALQWATGDVGICTKDD